MTISEMPSEEKPETANKSISLIFPDHANGAFQLRKSIDSHGEGLCCLSLPNPERRPSWTAGTRIAPLRSQFDQRHEDKSTVRQVGMRDGQGIRFQNQIFIIQNVNIDQTRFPTFPHGPYSSNTSQFFFNGLATYQQLIPGSSDVLPFTTWIVVQGLFSTLVRNTFVNRRGLKIC